MTHFNKIAFTKANRPTDKNHIDALKESIKKHGYYNTERIVVQKATHPAFNEHNLIDADSGEEITEFADYYVVLDGQHRYKAAIELGITPEYNEATYDDPMKYITTVNTSNKQWGNKQLIKAVVPMIEDDDVRGFMERYISDADAAKASPTPGVISMYLFGQNNKLGKGAWKNVLLNSKLAEDADVDTATKILDVFQSVCQQSSVSGKGSAEVKKLPYKMALITAVRELANVSTNGRDNTIEAASLLTYDELVSISKEKQMEAIDKAKEILRNHLVTVKSKATQ